MAFFRSQGKRGRAANCIGSILISLFETNEIRSPLFSGVVLIGLFPSADKGYEALSMNLLVNDSLLSTLKGRRRTSSPRKSDILLTHYGDKC